MLLHLTYKELILCLKLVEKRFGTIRLQPDTNESITEAYELLSMKAKIEQTMLEGELYRYDISCNTPA